MTMRENSHAHTLTHTDTDGRTTLRIRNVT